LRIDKEGKKGKVQEPMDKLEDLIESRKAAEAMGRGLNYFDVFDQLFKAKAKQYT